MNKMNNSNWSASLGQLTANQMLLLQQQFHQGQHQTNAQSLEQQMATIQQNLMYQQRMHSLQQQHQQQQSSKISSPFSSSFSVNSLLNPAPQNTQTANQQLAQAVLNRHIAQAVANIQQQQRPQQRPCLTNDSTFQAPASKKQKLNDSTTESSDLIQNPFNSSICSVSSPSSSSSAYSSSSLSFNEYTTPSQEAFSQNLNSNQSYNQNLDYLMAKSMENNNNQGSTSTSFNDSNDFLDGNGSERSSPSLLLNDSKLKTPSNVRRSNRKRIAADLQTPCCPICGLSLRLSDLQAHLNSELERLENVDSFCGQVADLIRNETTEAQTSNQRKRTSNGSEKIKPSNQIEANNDRRHVYLKIKENRHIRIKSKLRVRMKENQTSQTHQCPLCNESLSDSKDQINSHLQTCPMLQNDELENNRDFDSNDTSDSNQEGYETYEWAGQKRIRTITMLDNPAQGIDATNVKKEEFDGELNVDFDDNIAFGKPQFNESDLIPIKSEEKKKNLLRQAVIDKEKIDDEAAKQSSSQSLSEMEEEDNKHIKSESESREAFKCLICMEGYMNALISVNCWHVHCKTCWLQSLGAKKLCPQCKVITTPKDLRRIFL